MTVGWLTVAYVVLLPMYRNGMFTNAEYLEFRFGPAARLISVFIQIQYRTNVLANVAYSLYLTFRTVTDWSQRTLWGLELTWWFVGAIALEAAAYTASGGLKSVAVTDSLQSVVMLIASLVLWWTVWNAVGGWSSLQERLEQQSPALADAMLHVGSDYDPGVPPAAVVEREVPAGLMVFGWTIVLTAYCVVNHSQAMRMLAARSVWDMKMAAVLAGAVTMVVMWFNVTLGILGRALFPELTATDQIFPQLIDQFLTPGLLGLVIAGLLAGGISTFDSIGSALAALFTRDVYARFLVTNADDRHYLRVSRIATFVVIGISFVYVPFLDIGMVELYMQLVGVAVIPLLTVYLMGVLTRVHRSAGTVGLMAGFLCGLTRFAGSIFEVTLPVWWENKWWGYLWSIGVTAAAMVVISFIRGWASKEELSGLLALSKADTDAQSTTSSTVSTTSSDAPRPTGGQQGGWLETSRNEVPQMVDWPFPMPPKWYQSTRLWTVLLIASVVVLNLIVFW